ncbi:E3 ISG15--protein ligase HERC5-like [Eucyclogobius newberryi]|uniref:E3 ISG15--protein ligase HERC5-like n=1 Tax=Eucyclogobius newberryi TaxID=166745 RepID=UPI003B5B39FF
MLAWGEQSARGFRLKDGSYVSHTEDGVSFLDLSCPITDMCVGPRLLSFVNRAGNAFIIRVNPSSDGAWLRGRQKRLENKEKIQTVRCTNDTLFLLTNQGRVLCVLPHAPLSAFGAFRGVSVSQISCGTHHSLALTKDGEVFSWGVDSRGQLGVGKCGPGTTSPQHVKSTSDLPVVLLAAGGEQSFCLTVSGGVWSWGCNSCGQLGLGDTTDRHTPELLQQLHMKKASHICCGEEHTAVLTKDGVVYTFGSGQHGQLGHNSFRDELRPRLVAELWGSKVMAVACGRFHTLVLTDSHVYSCGAQDRACRGTREQDSAAVPLLVQLPGHESAEGGGIRQVFAGGHCSYASHQEQSGSTSGVLQHPPLTDLLTNWTSDAQPWKKTKREIARAFSSVSRLNLSFLDHRRHFETSSKHSGLDLSSAHTSFSKLLNKPIVMKEVERVCERLVLSLSPCPVGVECLRIYLLLTELLHVLHQLPRTHRENVLVEALATAILRLPEESIRVLGEWWSALAAEVRVRHVSVWKNAAPYASSISASKRLLQVVQLMYNRNKTLDPNRIPDSAFTTTVPLDMLVSMILWKSEPSYRSELGEVPILNSFPFLMDLQTRHKALKLNNYYLMIKNSLLGVMSEWWWLDKDILLLQRFTLRLRRERIVEDTFKQLSLANHRDLRRPLLVYLNEVVENDHINLNQKDFFHLVFHELVSAESGMFMFNDSATLAWFSSRATPPLEHYFLFGVLCGLAVFHLHMVFLPFPLALFKKILGVAPSLDDLCQLSSCTGQSLRCLLEEYSDDVIQSLDMDFKIYWDQMEVALDPHNPDRPVTARNKQEFVDAFVEHVFSSSVQSQFEEFRRGFFRTTDRDMVKLFSPEELRDIMVGQELTDWSRLKQSAVYEGVYHRNHPTIHMFWELFDELTEEQRKALLWFITGFERLPILTVDLKIIFQVLSIRQEGVFEDQYFPRSHTCFNGLELPLYSTKELMKSRLLEALAQVNSRQGHHALDIYNSMSI